MNTLREKTILLRQEGKSYNEINNLLNVPKSTLSDWLGNIVLSKEAQERIKERVHQGSINGLIKRNKNQTMLAQKRSKDIQENAISEIKSLSNNDLLIIGVALYWAEGYKRLKIKNGKEITSHPISLTNSDPEILTAFISFLVKSLGINKEKITVGLRIFPHMNAEHEIKYWSNTLDINKNQFYKPSTVISKSSQGKRPFNRLPHGTVQLRVADTNEFHRLIGLINGIKERLAVFNLKG